MAISTLFVSGFHASIGDDDVQRLFEPIGGYQGCRIRVVRNSTIVFVDFESRPLAKKASDVMNNTEVTIRENNCKLTIEFAKSSGGPEPAQEVDDKPDHGPYENKWRKFKREVEKRSRDEVPQTLYINKIPQDLTTREIGHIFRHFRGLRGIRLHQNATSGKVCFVDFKSRYTAEFVMGCLQGYQFDEKDKTGMNIEFSAKK